MKCPVPPFLIPPESAISHGGWHLKTPEGDGPLPSFIKPWDYQAVLELSAPVSIDRKTVAEACGLQPDSGLTIIVMARSSHTRIESVVAREEVPLSDFFDLAIQVLLPGQELGGRLMLETLLVVSAPKPMSGLAPQSPGSILWRSVQATDLEGVGTQFPTDTLNFAAVGLPADAGWQFTVDLSDPDARFMSAARLTLNSGHDTVERLLRGSKDEGTRQLLRTLNWDVTCQMARLAIANEDVGERELDYEDTSVAGVLRNLLGMVWPDVTPATLQEWKKNSPERIEIDLQQFGGLLK